MNRLAIASLLIVSQVGCGTLFNKNPAKVTLDPGVTLDGSSTASEIDQKEDHTVGYPDGSTCKIESGISGAYLILDLFMTGPVGIIIDAVTGGWKVSKGDCRGIDVE